MIMFLNGKTFDLGTKAKDRDLGFISKLCKVFIYFIKKQSFGVPSSVV